MRVDEGVIEAFHSGCCEEFICVSEAVHGRLELLDDVVDCLVMRLFWTV